MLEIARRPAKKGLTAPTNSIPAHLALARSQIGKYQDGPSILPLAAKIGELYPEMAGYCRLVVPTTSWCGLFCGHDLAVNGIRPPYNPKVDAQSFLWARAWLSYGTPVQRGQEQLGDILVFDFGGGDSHVTFHNGDSGSNYLCLGGNQSNQVKSLALSEESMHRHSASACAIIPAAALAPDRRSRFPSNAPGRLDGSGRQRAAAPARRDRR